MKVPHLILVTLLCAVLCLLGVKAQTQTHYTEGCRYGAEADTCLCPPGFSGAKCSEIDCGNGYVKPGTNYECTCQDDWTGILCGNCNTDIACKYHLGSSTAVCSNEVPVGSASTSSGCRVTDRSMISLLNGSPIAQIYLTPDPGGVNISGNYQVFKEESATNPREPIFSCYFDNCVDVLGTYSYQCDKGIAEPQVANPTAMWECSTFFCETECEDYMDFCSMTLKYLIPAASGQAVLISNGTYFNIRQQNVDLLSPCGIHAQCNTTGCMKDSAADTSVTQENTQQESTSESEIQITQAIVDNSVNFGDVVAIVIAVLIIALMCVALLVGILACLRARQFKRAGMGKNKSQSALADQHCATEGLGVAYDPVAFLDVSYKLKKDSPKLLDGVTGVVHPGEMVAVMGPSGAGKSTALDIIAGRRKSGIVGGEVWAMGVKVKGQTLRQNVGFVDQEYTPMATLTVSECLMYSSLLRLPNNTSMRVRKDRVEAVMRDVRITHVADNKIGNSVHRGISGGELRRLSIAAELVTGPALLYLDEPTSSLDSYNAHVVIDCLKSLVMQKKTMVILTIHQPSSRLFQMFDKCMLLTKGKMVYFGPTHGAAVSHFSSLGLPKCPAGVNVADFLMDVLVEAEVNTAEAQATGPASGRQPTISPKNDIEASGDYDVFNDTSTASNALTAASVIRSAEESPTPVPAEDNPHTSETQKLYKGTLAINDLLVGYAKSELALDSATAATNAISRMKETYDARKRNKRKDWGKNMHQQYTLTPPEQSTASDTETSSRNTTPTPTNKKELESHGGVYTPTAAALDTDGATTESTERQRDSRYHNEANDNVDLATDSPTNQSDPMDKDIKVQGDSRGSFWTQTLTLSHRTLSNLGRDPHLIIGHWAVGIMTGVVLGLLYFNSGVGALQDNLDGQIISQVQQQLGALLLLCAFLSFGGLTCLEVFESERVLFLHERANGFYQAGSFFLSKLLFDTVLLRIIPPIFTGTLFYFLMDMRAGFVHFVVFITVLTLCNLTAASICMLVGLAITNRALALLVASLVILLSLSLTNLFNNSGSMPSWAAWVHYLSFFNYAYEALVINELKDINFQGVALGAEALSVEANQLLDELGFEVENYALDIFVLTGLFLLGQLLTFLLLQYRIKLVR